ncbi:RNHCP domain-containing protein [Frankia tisae]|uniref:RNHCP domain-containing protein n=1 Tax=Frankia tisae TaxID=2950104 RepID=UPI0021BE6D0E|nr:RNHCP domain-containing protein [Frankia tisae]
MTRRFTRTTEDFVCLVCGTAVRGDGYTNHCPSCLCSRHVDVHPGDRTAGCGGVMRPVAVETRTHDVILTHACERCGHRRRNRTAPADDRDALLAVAAAAAQAAVFSTTEVAFPAMGSLLGPDSAGARPRRRTARARTGRGR